jgi:hypothetical protein
MGWVTFWAIFSKTHPVTLLLRIEMSRREKKMVGSGSNRIEGKVVTREAANDHLIHF